MDITIILTYGTLLISVISIWFKYKIFNKIPLWLFFLTLSFLFAFLFERVSLISIMYTSIVGFIIHRYYQTKNGYVFCLVLIVSIPLMFHFSFLGFDNYKYINAIKLSPYSVPYNLYFNLDKTAVGIFIIAFGFESLKINVLSFIKQVAIHLLLMVLLFFVLAIVLGYSKFEPKLPYFTPVWIIVNLFFTCLAEEAIFRRLIQQKIYDTISSKYALVISLLVASLAFGIAHYNGGLLYILLASVAGFFYGYIYYRTKRIEASMLLHVLFNLIHLLTFTYPALAS
ncbi:CPBP family intramembrane glutamic endopeptidase [uncultured Dokdonia sp.]|uniref:CPBP family intramembrane glutamic endopeptidase n=1 Tax=uncultured Dokdonia sp. TaxID=575653 RepID=UPI00262FEBD4|nr:CPBP family intramembrane glutamic endopeptidase [uncultured Dokdonia sp.]